MFEEYSGAAIAPAWFAPTLQAVLQAALQPIRDVIAELRRDIAELRRDIAGLHTSAHNSTITRDDTVIPQPLPNFPRTIHELHSLKPGEQITAIENYYRLSHTGNIETRINRIRRVYGV